MHISIKVVTGLLAFFIFLYFPVIKVRSTPSLKPVYEYDIRANSTVSSSVPFSSKNYVFHLPVSGSYYSSHQYKIIKLDQKGNQVLSFSAPNKPDLSKSRETLLLDGKDGFLTYPPDGSFFLWYPRLGNYTFFYDQSGEFLWSHKSSHYLKAFPSGEYILAMTGDHSRAFFLLPDLSVTGSTEGTLLINYMFSSSYDNESMQICLGYLDGDLVFYNPRKKSEFRLNTGGTTKSLACDFKNSGFAAHVESANQPDSIKIAYFDETKNPPAVKWKADIKLSTNYNFTIPMGLHNGYLIAILPTGQSLTLFAYDAKGTLQFSSDLGAMDTPIEDWRIISIPSGIVAWNSNNVYLMNPDVIFSRHLSVQNVAAIKDQLFIQTGNSIISYYLEK